MHSIEIEGWFEGGKEIRAEDKHLLLTGHSISNSPFHPL